MYDRFVIAVVLAAAVAAPAAAQDKTVKLIPACEALMTAAERKDNPDHLPLKVVDDATLKTAPYKGKLGGVKVSTALTGSVELGGKAAGQKAPFVCIASGKAAGYYYISLPGASHTPDTVVADLYSCSQESKGEAAALASCLRAHHEQSETAVQAAYEASRKTLAAGTDPDALENLEASQKEWLSYRTSSCGVFQQQAPGTDLPHFLTACQTRLNLARASKLQTKATF